VLFSSRGKNADKFTLWASKTLFTAQLGTKAQKNKLASKLLGCDTNSLVNVLNTMPCAVSCIYLFAVGTVGDCREEYNIDETVSDNKILAKYGRSKDLIRRTGEHKLTYGAQIELLIFHLIDPECITKAENSLSLYFENLKIDPIRELVVIDKKMMKNLKDQYLLIGSMYVGKMKDHATVLKELTNEHEKKILEKEKELLQKEKDLQKEEYENKLSHKDNELLQKDNDLLQKRNELLQKELELTNIKRRPRK
jgi:hypothetical protein